jgi:hypothetical protein
LQQTFVARFRGRRVIALPSSPQRLQRSRNRLPLWIVGFIENILSGDLLGRIEWLTKNQDATRLDPRSH